MNDLNIQLYDEICSSINNSQLPLSSKYLIIKEIYGEVESAYNQYRMEYYKQQQMVQQEEKETKSEE